jgi:two-component system phosphate regulon response regulator PhoB
MQKYSIQKNILIVDDEEDILELVEYNLMQEGFQTRTAISGEDALKLARAEEHPDLIILDLMLPGVDGLDVCKLLKTDPETSSISILMLTAKGEEADIVKGLELGADDYITKPFSPKVLVARVKSVLRRYAQPEIPDDEVIKYNEIIKLQLRGK